jgi:hypothetical protein
MRFDKEIKCKLKKVYKKELKKRESNHLETLISMTSGMLKSKSVKLSDIAGECINAGKEESKTMKYRRWLQNKNISCEVYFLPFLSFILESISKREEEIYLVIDGSVTGRGCMTLMVSIIYQSRALPVAWITRKKKKGHFPQQAHIELIKTVSKIIPEGKKVVCLGDGEFDGTQWLATLEELGWNYVCRTASNAIYYHNEMRLSMSHLCPEKGNMNNLSHALFTDNKFQSQTLIAWWRDDSVKPLYLISSYSCAKTACLVYQKRFVIETMFGDFKSRGFNLQKSGLSEPERLQRLLMPVALAYIWLVFLGHFARHSHWQAIIHRKNRCDLSLFQLGKRLLKRFLTNNISFPDFLSEFHYVT